MKKTTTLFTPFRLFCRHLASAVGFAKKTGGYAPHRLPAELRVAVCAEFAKAAPPDSEEARHWRLKLTEAVRALQTSRTVAVTEPPPGSDGEEPERLVPAGGSG